MAKTVLNNISTFDPIYNKTVTFSDSGAVAYKNRLLIIDAVLDTTVYDQTITSMKYEHVIPANTLTAGKQYTAQAQTFDINNVASTILTNINNESLTVLGIKLNKKIWEEANVIK